MNAMLMLPTPATPVAPTPATPSALAGVARTCVLVDLRITQYTGRRKDRITQEEVQHAKGAASRRAASVYKSLFADCAELEAISSVQSKARQRHYAMTTPWSDVGTRLLPLAGRAAYKAEMDAYQVQYSDAVRAFLDRYDTLVAAAAFQLGALFERSEYPLRKDIERRFSMTVEYSPLPMSGDFRLDTERDLQLDMAREYEERATRMVQAAQRDAWTRLHEALKHLTERLEDKDGKRNKIFDSLVSNPLELCGLLSTLNITNDPVLEAARVQLERTMLGTSADELRKSPDERAYVKENVEQILSAFDWSATQDE